MIAADENHPLRFLLENGRFKVTRGLPHSELADRPDLIQMGHIDSNKLGGVERIMLQGAWENQYDNYMTENPHAGGAIRGRAAIDIGGIAVHLETAQSWEKYGLLEKGTCAEARRVIPSH